MPKTNNTRIAPSKKPVKRASLARYKQSLLQLPRLQPIQLAIIVTLVILVGALIVWVIRAASLSNTEIETWSATNASGVAIKDDPTAAGGQYLEFLAPTTASPVNAAGAQLPISYPASTIPANALYVSPNGLDTNSGSSSSPYATLSKAVSAATSGGTVIVKGGTYYGQGNITLNKTLKIMAASGETPKFIGSKQVSGGWATEGSYQYIPYTPQVPSNGIMALKDSNDGLTGDYIGKYQDQVWVGNTRLKQVADKANLTDGKFWVDQAGAKLYLTSNDVAKGNIEITGQNKFMTHNAPGSSIEGLQITRYSDAGGSYGVILMNRTADNVTLKNLEINDNALIAIGVFGDKGTLDTNVGTTLKNITLDNSNWMGVASNYTDNLTLDSMKITHMNMAGEFKFSPVSGAFKVTRSRQIKVLNSIIADNNSHGLWFDQTNQDADIVNNQLTGNAGSSVFYEISDDMLMVNNYIKSSGSEAVKTAGSSGLKFVNNTIIGGSQPLAIYVDSRSIPGCSVPTSGCTAAQYNEWDVVHPQSANIDWMPRLDLLVNNIIAYPTGQGFCKSTAPLCITQQNGSNTATYRPIDTVIHQAEAARNIPRTYMNGNVYANGSGRILSTQSLSEYSNTTDLSAYLAGSPVLISGMETTSKVGNSYVNADGSPSLVLSALHGQAEPVPTDANINQYLSPGLRHYGVTYK